MPPSSETVVWEGRASQAVNLVAFAASVLLAVGVAVATVLFPPLQPWGWLALLLPLLFAAKQYLDVRSELYTLTNERLKITRGILSKRIDALELYRVKDITMMKPVVMRLLGLGDIVLDTSDHTTPKVRLHAIRDAERVNDLIRTQVERQRDRKRVTEVDMT